MEKSKIKYCFLDMDGVVADFMSGVCKAHGRESPYNDPKSYGIWDTEKLWGISVKEFWKPIFGIDFWVNLEKTLEADELVAFVEEKFNAANIAFLTAPSEDPNCILGKKKWVQKHFPKYKNNIIFTGNKKFLAGPDRLLIDDRDKNVKEFGEHGGRIILFPRPWNRRFACKFPNMEVVKLEVMVIRNENLDLFNEENI